MKLKIFTIAAVMLIGTTSAIALVQKPIESNKGSLQADTLVLQLEASLPRASSLDRAP
jgi:hypothetical protein